MRYLCDSTWAIDFLAGQPDAISFQPTLIRDGLALSIISYTELWEGVLFTKHDRASVELSLRAFLRPITILPYSRAVAQRVGQLRGEMRQRGLRFDHRALDLLIAGTAFHHNLTMVTSDVDFDDIPGLALLNPRTRLTKTNPA